MTFEAPNMLPALPEILLLGVACLVLLVDVLVQERYRQLTYELAQAGLVATLVVVLWLYPSESVVTFHGNHVSDVLGTVLKAGVLVVSFFAFLYARAYLLERGLLKGEFFILGLFAVLGMLVLISAHSLLTVYLGLELLSLSLYAMVALNRDSAASSEAAMKYFVLGALASGMLLYGMSLLYGATGSLDLQRIATVAADAEARDLVLLLGLVFVVVGLAFKLGAVPFHMWVPDVYQGALTPVTLFISTAPKIAAFAMTMRILVDALPGLQADWQQMLMAMAILSMGIGNVVAISQSNIKRMLAYSTIAHVGFILLGVLAGTQSGYAAAMFYTLVYALMGLGGFGMLILLSRSGFDAEHLADFKGLARRSPWFALMMLVLMFSMAGVPPFLGFWAKWSVLREIVSVDLVWLAVVAVVFSIIGAFYYLRIVRLMYFDEPDDTSPIVAGTDLQVMLSVNSLAILALGIYPSALMGVCIAAFAA